jgi:hypothetical protein
MLGKKPIGVTIIAVLTLLTSLTLGFIFLITVAVSCVGMGSGLPLTLPFLPYYLPSFLGLFAFVSSFLLLGEIRSRFLWCFMIAYWVVLFMYFVWAYTSTNILAWMYYVGGPLSTPYGWYSVLRITLLPTPFIYAIGSPIYFFTKKPREYFHV